uniref:Uncharacterized protein n=1 Tax=Chromera velia CCMP2878 TaxID=1169474 RepID=A0A0G4GYJ1_9ALVE|eukprot:Cvel_23894.t1-p1 / transcript=Cvel_23894.t1 / gene=Cvel_23894 / organism=Chromera_velia_CCMP2878 / gene_product=hypothetical protein / transcript_product=hypothetical protein / location=Cvel_scaffold2518:1275-3998(+) / protein_length=462 / sequence_SO=supercontig / SO=protein_coding / is_pseudo=false
MRRRLGGSEIAIGAEKGFGGGTNPHVLSYIPNINVIWAPLLRRELSVCSSLTMWSRHIVWLLYACALMLVIGYVGFPDGEMGGGPACADGKNIRVCQLEALLADSKAEFRFLIAFVLAGYVAGTVAMWGIRRKNYASLCGNARNLSIQILSFVPVEHQDEQLMQTRKNLSRWVMLAFELAFLKAKGAMDKEEAKAYLVEEGLLVEGEWENMVVGDRHSSVFFWIQTQLAILSREGRIEQEFVAAVSQSVGSMRGQANDLMSSLDRDKPYPYVALCGVLVMINIVIFSTWKGVLWSVWFHTFGSKIVEQPKLWVDILVLFTWNLSYQALYELSYVLYNPFGDRLVDVGHETIGRGIRRLSFALAEGHVLPPALSLYPTPPAEKTKPPRNFQGGDKSPTRYSGGGSPTRQGQGGEQTPQGFSDVSHPVPPSQSPQIGRSPQALPSPSAPNTERGVKVADDTHFV